MYKIFSHLSSCRKKNETLWILCMKQGCGSGSAFSFNPESRSAFGIHKKYLHFTAGQNIAWKIVQNWISYTVVKNGSRKLWDVPRRFWWGSIKTNFSKDIVEIKVHLKDLKKYKTLSFLLKVRWTKFKIRSQEFLKNY